MDTKGTGGGFHSDPPGAGDDGKQGSGGTSRPKTSDAKCQASRPTTPAQGKVFGHPSDQVPGIQELVARNLGGRPQHRPTDAQRREAEGYASNFMPHGAIAGAMPEFG